ncbi:MAG TPA: hypothetical protein VMH81_40390 [Bryobacteraceae bacterium]|nr:hypothetical protein [Bryobacteraceae bacterium]
MDLAKVLQQLHEELDNLNAAISSLERLEEAGKNRSREQEFLGQLAPPPRAGRKRRSKGSEEDLRSDPPPDDGT